jgi:hypothetical protein
MKTYVRIAAFAAAAFGVNIAVAAEAAKTDEEMLVCKRTGVSWTKERGAGKTECSALKHKDTAAIIAKACGARGDCVVEAFLEDSERPRRVKARKGGASPKNTTETGVIADIRAQLFYETTGILSENIAPPEWFTIVNPSIGEGSLKEPANDMLVSIKLSCEANKLDMLSMAHPKLIITDEKEKIIAQRTFNSLLFSVDNYRAIVSNEKAKPEPINGKFSLKTSKAVFVPDVPSGRIKIEAVYEAEIMAIWLFFGDAE